MISRMYADILFDREITDEHYISPGGYEIRDIKGNTLQFDFEDYCGWVDKDDRRILHIEHRNLDLDCFPDAKYLDDFLSNLDEFVEFYIYTGDYDEPEINPVKVIDAAFCDYYNGKDYYFGAKYFKNLFETN